MSLDVYLEDEESGTDIYSANITHNLSEMATEVSKDFYKALWRPEELRIKKASELIPFLETGIKKLNENPEHYEQFNPENEWGSYLGLLGFTKAYLDACKKYPNAAVWISR